MTFSIREVKGGNYVREHKLPRELSVHVLCEIRFLLVSELK